MQLHRRYRFVRTLGRGATGTVQLVEDLANPGTPIALKRLTAATDAILRSAFEREFTVLAALSMPGVARVIDFGVATPDLDHDEPGGPFMTRAYVEGAPLDEAVRDREVRDCAVLVGRLCRIVAPLHRAGIVHGDIKPSNVIVTPDGMPVLIDFGLASLPGQRVRGAGTPGFMAPEVAAGGPATTASDVYALGATLWFLLTGAPPRTEHPTTHKGLVASNEPVTRALLDVAQRALAPEPSHRLPSVLELEAALAAVVPLPTAPFAFVPPRPRGHEAPLAEAERVIAAQLAGSGRPQQIVLLAGAPGSGRSTLLRELRWRAQLRGTTTLAIGLSGATAPELLRALARAASFHGPADGLAPEPSVDRVVELLLALVARGPTLLLVDDLDRAEPAALDALRDVVHAGGLERLAVVATWDPAVSTAALQPTESVSIPPLTREQLESACRDVLGVVDAAVVEALWRRSGGLPGPAADMLAALYEVGAPTADDVESLPTATARRRGALAELASLPSTAADGLVALAIAGGRLPRALLGDVLGLQPRLADALVASGLVRAGPGDEILELVDRELGCVLRETSEPATSPASRAPCSLQPRREPTPSSRRTPPRSSAIRPPWSDTPRRPRSGWNKRAHGARRSRCGRPWRARTATDRCARRPRSRALVCACSQASTTGRERGRSGFSLHRTPRMRTASKPPCCAHGPSRRRDVWTTPWTHCDRSRRPIRFCTLVYSPSAHGCNCDAVGTTPSKPR
ncbi:MAG: serine/threonine-protein kinase [Myxococcales bacterium]|nr:serine/threonine-protein kinase [Myxococcales bacterium]